MIYAMIAIGYFLICLAIALGLCQAAARGDRNG